MKLNKPKNETLNKFIEAGKKLFGGPGSGPNKGGGSSGGTDDVESIKKYHQIKEPNNK
jgi:hypothetical protein